MTCPHRSGGTNGEDGGTDSGDGTLERGMDRRSFMRSALFIGGSALSAATALYGTPESVAAQSGEDGVSLAARRNRQHAWNEYTVEAHGTHIPPEHHLVLFLDYEKDGEPTADDRTRAADAFDNLESAVEWHHEGLLFTVGYSMGYFERYEADLPTGMQLDNDAATPRMFTAQDLIDGPTVPNPTKRDASGQPKMIDMQVTLPREDPVADDGYDACIHLASDHVQNLLAAEQALWGEKATWNDVDFSEANLDGIFTKPESYPDRRTGFSGNGNLAENVDAAEFGDDTARERFEESVDQGADLSMGYDDLYKNSNPREDNATILEDQNFIPFDPQPPGVFANGSIMHVSKMNTDLEGWYGDNTDAERRERMFSPHHAKADVGDVGENLGNSNAPATSTDMPMRDESNQELRDVAERTQEDAEAGRNVGHAQKIARTRAKLEGHFVSEGGRDLIRDGVPLQDDPVTQERQDDLPNHDGVQQREPGLIRRDFNTLDDTGENESGVHFVALQNFSIYVAYMRHAMNGLHWETGITGTEAGEQRPGFDHEGDVPTENNGIVEYLETKRRGNFVLPPLELRALPHARALRPDLAVEHEGSTYSVTVADGDVAAAIDDETVRFGYYRTVNAGGGATPAEIDRSDGAVTYRFPESELGELQTQFGNLEPGQVRTRLFAKREADRKPVFATATFTQSDYDYTAMGGDYDANPDCEYPVGDESGAESEATGTADGTQSADGTETADETGAAGTGTAEASESVSESVSETGRD